MWARIDFERIKEVVRFYQAAALNAAFGFSLYAILIFLHFNMYLAQICAHVIGVGFNYITYSRYAFRNIDSNKLYFVATYALNYMVSFVSLLLVSVFITSPYFAGLIALIFASIVNYFMLKYHVFTKRASK